LKENPHLSREAPVLGSMTFGENSNRNKKKKTECKIEKEGKKLFNLHVVITHIY